MFVFLLLCLKISGVLSSNHQINFVKDQQEEINAKLKAEYMALEEEISGLGLEVSFSLLVLKILLLLFANHEFPKSKFIHEKDNYHVSLKQMSRHLIINHKDCHISLCRNILIVLQTIL